jgi:L-fucose mutarotase/ribose pyranase (RbsD/FucU family)
MPTLLPALLALVHFPAKSQARQATESETWLRDPLSHPAIAVMSLDEVADLPAAELRSRVRS